ncbi:MAG: CopG family antitoxin [Candidatus Binatia bacterium]
MPQKAKLSLPATNPHASYEAKARYYERYSTQELLAAGHLEEVGIRQYPRKTETLSLRVDKTLLAQLKQLARKKKLPLGTLIRTWLVKHAQEDRAA